MRDTEERTPALQVIMNLTIIWKLWGTSNAVLLKAQGFVTMDCNSCGSLSCSLLKWVSEILQLPVQLHPILVCFMAKWAPRLSYLICHIPQYYSIAYLKCTVLEIPEIFLLEIPEILVPNSFMKASYRIISKFNVDAIVNLTFEDNQHLNLPTFLLPSAGNVTLLKCIKC